MIQKQTLMMADFITFKEVNQSMSKVKDENFLNS